MVLYAIFNSLLIKRLMFSGKDGKIFNAIVAIGLGVNVLFAVYLLLMYFEVI